MLELFNYLRYNSYFSYKVTNMITNEQFKNEVQLIIANAVREDVGDGDHSSLACIPSDAIGKAKLIIKDNGIIAGISFAKQVFQAVEISCKYIREFPISSFYKRYRFLLGNFKPIKSKKLSLYSI